METDSQSHSSNSEFWMRGSDRFPVGPVSIAGQSSEGAGSPAPLLKTHAHVLLGRMFSKEKGVSDRLCRQTPERHLSLPNIQVKWLLCHQVFYLSLGTVSQFFFKARPPCIKPAPQVHGIQGVWNARRAVSLKPSPNSSAWQALV